jgi:hypothetical protein
MRIYGDINLDPIGNQISGLRLENLSTNPITSTGRIYFNTSTHKVMVWSGTTWVQVSSGADYTAGDGLRLDISNKFHVNLYDSTANISGLQFVGGYLTVKADMTEFDLDGDGLSLKTGGIVNDLLAGGITDDKLNQITTADKVAASAVEDKFLRNDGDDYSSGGLSIKDVILRPETTPVPATGKVYYDIGVDQLFFYNGSGWQQLYTGSANVHSATGTAPITVSPTTGDVVVSMTQADTATDGWLSSTDWDTFNDKQIEIVWSSGLQYTAPTASVKLAVTNPALQFDGFGGLGVLVKPLGGILADVNGIYLDALFTGFQAVYNLDPTRPHSYFRLDSGGSWTIKNFPGTVDIIHVAEGTLGTSLVTMSNVEIQGDLDVLGDNTWIETTNINIHSRDLIVGFENPVIGSPTSDTYFRVLRGSDNTVGIRYNETSNIWEFTNDGSLWWPFITNVLGKTSQSFVGATVITFTHGLGDLYPVFQIFDTGTGAVIQPLEISPVDVNTTTITFDGPQTGLAVAVGGNSIPPAGPAAGKFAMTYGVFTPPWTITITAAMHGLGSTDELYIQVMDNSSPRVVLDEEDCPRTVSTAGTVTIGPFAVTPAQGKIIILK